MTSNLRRCLIFARKPVNINVLRSASPKLAHVPANQGASLSLENLLISMF